MSKIDFQNGFALGLASGGVVEVADTTEIDALENLIDESGVIENTEGTVNEKVEKLIDWLKFFTQEIKGINFATCNGYCIKETPIIDCTNYKYFANAFAETSRTENGVNIGLEIVRLKNTQNITHWGSTFQSSKALHTIEILDFSGAANRQLLTTFDLCTNLVSLKIIPNTIKQSIVFKGCSKLSADSIQSIIDGLATGVTGQTLTLSRTAVNKAFETEEGANNGSTEEASEWFNLIATKPDWTITLS